MLQDLAIYHQTFNIKKASKDTGTGMTTQTTVYSLTTKAQSDMILNMIYSSSQSANYDISVLSSAPRTSKDEACLLLIEKMRMRDMPSYVASL
jgi:hypothetical protein